MTTPGPPVIAPTPPTPVSPPTTGDYASVKAWTVYQQQLKEFNNPRPVPVVPFPPANAPTKSIHPDWVNPCVECGAQVQFPCVGPNGIPLGYLHAPRLMLKPPPALAVSVIPPPLNTFNKNGL